MPKLTEAPEPIGKFILDQKEVVGTSTAHGVFYHYSEVCNLLKLYKEHIKQ